MKRATLIKALAFSIILFVPKCFGYDYVKAGHDLNRNIVNNCGLGNTYTIHETNDKIFVNGPNGYTGVGSTSGNNTYYSSWDSDNNSTHGHGAWSGNTYYYNEYSDSVGNSNVIYSFD